MRNKYSLGKRPSSVEEASRESVPLPLFDAPHAIDADRLAETLDFSLSSVLKHQVGVALQLITDTPAA